MPRLVYQALLASFSILCWSKALLADPLAQLAIQWEAPSECPSRDALIDGLRRDLEGSQAPSVRLAVVARVERSRADVWKVTIVTESAEGINDRVVNSRTCAALLDATSLIVAMMIDPETASNHARTIDEEPPADSGPVTRGAVTGPPANAPWRSADARAPASPGLRSGVPETRPALPIAGAAALGSALDYGSLPGYSGVFRGTAALLYGPLRAEGLFGYWLAKNQIGTLSDLPGAGGKYAKISLLGRVCADVWRPSVLTVSPCLGMGIAWFSATANDTVQAHRSRTSPAAEPNLGALATVALTSLLALRLDLDVAVPLNRPSFGYTRGAEQRVLHTAAWASVRTGIGLELKFGR